MVAIGGRLCGHHVGAAGRDAEAMACSMDRAGRALGGDLRRPEGVGRAYVEVNLSLSPHCCTLPRGTYMTRMPWHRGSLVGPSVEVLMSNINGRQCREMRGRATKIPTSRRSTFCIISKREAVGMDRRRCGLIEHDGGRDAKAVACRMDHAKRLQVAISVARSDAWQASAGARPS